MAFRKRNIAVGRSPQSTAPTLPDGRAQAVVPAIGVRPSPLASSCTVTSTGTPSLDALMGGHSGLALGSSLLVEESGTTDFAGALLRYYAAEGLCQGHVLHLVGVGEGWVRDLPGIATDRGTGKDTIQRGSEDKMKIAWRYESLGRAPDRGTDRASPTATSSSAEPEAPFCHAFDLTKRLAIPADTKINHIPLTGANCFDNISQSLSRSLSASATNSIHRLVVPSLLSPALYPPPASRPEHVLAFLRALRGLLRQHSRQLTAMLSLPLALHARASGLVHWAELLSDGVLELTPFPHSADASTTTSSLTLTKDSSSSSDAAQSTRDHQQQQQQQQPQGLVHVHRLPLLTERGEGGAGAGNSLGADLAFALSRRRFAIAPFALPPVEGDNEAQAQAGRVTAKDVEF